MAYLGIGTNLGDREANLDRALGGLKDAGVRVLAVSKVYETPPWGVEDQPAFLNMALKVETELSPRHLLVALKDIEKAMGRVEAERWGPRVIDIDILLYDDAIVREEGLLIPHTHMHMRRFVLEPLAEIAPEVVHPVLKRSVLALLRGLDSCPG